MVRILPDNDKSEKYLDYNHKGINRREIIYGKNVDYLNKKNSYKAMSWLYQVGTTLKSILK